MTDAIRLTFFGDSICVGQGVSIYRGWVTRMAQDIDGLSRDLGREVLVTNASINGRTTRQALEDMPYQIQSHGVDILLVQFGLNDCNYWVTDRGLPRVSLAAFMANLSEIIGRGRIAGAKRILLNNNHPTSRTGQTMPHTTISYEDSNRAYNEAVRQVARQERADDIVFTDIEETFRKRIAAGVAIEDFLLSDGLHLGLRGHDLYFEIMQPLLHKVVRGFASAA